MSAPSSSHARTTMDPTLVGAGMLGWDAALQPAAAGAAQSGPWEDFPWRRKRTLLDRMEEDERACAHHPGCGPSKERRRVLQESARQNGACEAPGARGEGDRRAGGPIRHHLEDHQLRHAQVQRQEMEQHLRRMQGRHRAAAPAPAGDADMADACEGAWGCAPSQVLFDYEGNREVVAAAEGDGARRAPAHAPRGAGAALVAPGPDQPACEHCGRWGGASELTACANCERAYCRLCSLRDYSLRDTRTFCLDCAHFQHYTITKGR